MSSVSGPVAAPAPERQPEQGCRQRGARQHAVAAPGQAATEPAQRLVVQLAHRVPEMRSICSALMRACGSSMPAGGICAAARAPAGPSRGPVGPGDGLDEAIGSPVGTGGNGLTAADRYPGCRKAQGGGHEGLKPGWRELQPLWHTRAPWPPTMAGQEDQPQQETHMQADHEPSAPALAQAPPTSR